MRRGFGIPSFGLCSNPTYQDTTLATARTKPSEDKSLHDGTKRTSTRCPIADTSPTSFPLCECCTYPNRPIPSLRPSQVSGSRRSNSSVQRGSANASLLSSIPYFHRPACLLGALRTYEDSISHLAFHITPPKPLRHPALRCKGLEMKSLIRPTPAILLLAKVETTGMETELHLAARGFDSMGFHVGPCGSSPCKE